MTVKKKYLFLALILVVLIWKIDFDWLLHTDYRHLRNFSDRYEKSIEENILSAAEKEKSEITLREVVPFFQWDTACVFDGYSRLREDVLEFHGNDYPILQYFPQTNESGWALVLIKENRVVYAAQNMSREPIYLKYHYGACGDRRTARFKPILPGAFIPDIYKRKPWSEQIAVMPECHALPCNFIYIGEPHD